MSQRAFRPANQTDAEFLRGLFAENKHLGSFSQQWYRFWDGQAPNEFWLIAFSDDAPVGFVHYRVRLKDQYRVVYEIAVSEKRKGHGRAILDHIGYPIELKTDADNPESNSFYRGMGFNFAGRKPSKNGKKLFNIWVKF